MDVSTWFFISSGLFLGWSLGANHAVNVFGTAVVSKMIKFKTAAVIAGVFVILGAVLSGEGTTKTINDLGSVNAIAGSFCVALAVGIAVTAMTKLNLPVSTSQAVIGGIIGWNIFTGSPTDAVSLYRILFSWVASPIIAGLFAFLFFKLIKVTVLKWKIHLLEIDSYTRAGLVIVGALASYSLGANNIANVMGMFISAPLFENLNVYDLFTITGVEKLFFLGGVSIAIGISSYGRRIMETVGKDLYKISPITGFVVVLAELVVLTLFTSQTLESFLLNNNLPSIPLVPLSTTQAFIGAVIGVGLAKDPLSIHFKVLGRIAIGWGIAPLIAGIITFISLFFMQNVFEQKVVHPVPYEISESVISKIKEEGIDTTNLGELVGKRFFNTKIFRNELLDRKKLTNNEMFLIFTYSIVDSFKIDTLLVPMNPDPNVFSPDLLNTIKLLHGKSFSHKIDFNKAVINEHFQWNSGNKLKKREIDAQVAFIENLFRVHSNKNQKSNNILNNNP